MPEGDFSALPHFTREQHLQRIATIRKDQYVHWKQELVHVQKRTHMCTDDLEHRVERRRTACRWRAAFVSERPRLLARLRSNQLRNRTAIATTKATRDSRPRDRFVRCSQWEDTFVATRTHRPRTRRRTRRRPSWSDCASNSTKSADCDTMPSASLSKSARSRCNSKRK